MANFIPNFSISRDDIYNAMSVQNSFDVPTIDDVAKKSATIAGQLLYQTTTKTLFYSDGLKWVELASSDFIPSADYVIIGAGTAGCILARKLSDSGASVAVIDCGDFRYDDPVIQNPIYQANANTLTYGQKYAKNYPLVLPNVPFFPSNFLTPLVYSEGSGSVGGGCAHNFMIGVKGDPYSYNAWATASGDNFWLYNNMLPLMKELETYTPNSTVPNPAQRGSTGPINVTQNPPLTLPLYNGIAAVTGTVVSDDYNDPTLGTLVSGANQNLVTPNPGSVRSYSAPAFLPMSPSPGAVIDSQGRGLNGRNLQIITSSRATKINFDGTTAVSVDFIQTDADGVTTTKRVFLKSTGKVISCAGAIQTPKLLMLSGIGPTADLTALGINTVVNSYHVGKNMRNQYGTRATITTPAPIQAGQSFLDGSPYTTATGNRLLQFLASPTQSTTLVLLSSLLVANSLGDIKVVSKDPLIDPEVNTNLYTDGAYTVNGTDANLMVSSLKIIRDAVAAAGAGYSLIAPNPASTDAQFNTYALTPSNIVVQSHITGTTQMGTSIANGVVDGNLKVFGTTNVHVCDIGVEPYPTTGNTCLGAYYLALGLAAKLGFPTPPIL